MRAEKFANQTLHQTPDSPAVLAGAGGGAGELVVSSSKKYDNSIRNIAEHTNKQQQNYPKHIFGIDISITCSHIVNMINIHKEAAPWHLA